MLPVVERKRRKKVAGFDSNHKSLKAACLYLILFQSGFLIHCLSTLKYVWVLFGLWDTVLRVTSRRAILKYCPFLKKNDDAY